MPPRPPTRSSGSTRRTRNCAPSGRRARPRPSGWPGRSVPRAPTKRSPRTTAANCCRPRSSRSTRHGRSRPVSSCRAAAPAVQRRVGKAEGLVWNAVPAKLRAQRPEDKGVERQARQMAKVRTKNGTEADTSVESLLEKAEKKGEFVEGKFGSLESVSGAAEKITGAIGSCRTTRYRRTPPRRSRPRARRRTCRVRSATSPPPSRSPSMRSPRAPAIRTASWGKDTSGNDLPTSVTSQAAEGIGNGPLGNLQRPDRRREHGDQDGQGHQGRQRGTRHHQDPRRDEGDRRLRGRGRDVGQGHRRPRGVHRFRRRAVGRVGHPRLQHRYRDHQRGVERDGPGNNGAAPVALQRQPHRGQGPQARCEERRRPRRAAAARHRRTDQVLRAGWSGRRRRP